jgi:hypothetical protein
LRTGKRTKSVYPLVSLPRGSGHIRRDASAMRLRLEEAVIAKHGQLSAVHDDIVNRACTHEVVRQATAKLIRENPTMPFAEKLTAFRDLSDFAEKRGRAIALLGLDVNVAPADADPLAQLWNNGRPGQ